MDPITALGLASGILSFLTFSTALLKVGHGVCVTPSGRNEQNMTREVVIDETKAFLDQLMPPDDSRLKDDEGLCRLVEETRRIAKEMMAILAKIKPKKSGTVANLRSAIQHTLSQPDMEDLEKRMDQCRTQLDLHLNSGYFKNLKMSLDMILDQGDLNKSQLSQLQHNVDHLRKGVVVESLSDEAQDQVRRLIGVQQESLDRTCQRLILNALKFPDMHDRFHSLSPAHKRTFRWLLSSGYDYKFHYDSSLSGFESSSSDSESSAEDVDELDEDTVEDLPDENDGRSPPTLHSETSAYTTARATPEEAFDGSASNKTEAVHQDLEHSPPTHDRLPSQVPLLNTDDAASNVSEGNKSDSIHTDSDTDSSMSSDCFDRHETATTRASARNLFLTWLSSSNEIFHICGKLGSGKSTLMKFLLENKRTKAELKAWAGDDKQLVCASFFFWKPGSKLQKSLPGLCRSLLHDILCARPELIQSVLPATWARVKDQPQPQSEIDIPTGDIQIGLKTLIRNQKL